MLIVLDPDAARTALAAGELGCPLPEAVAALGSAARGFVLALATPPPPRPALVMAGHEHRLSRIIAERHRQGLHARLGVIDPTGLLAGRRGWLLINVLTRGWLLAPGPDG